MPATSAAHNRLLFLLRPFTVLMKQTRQAVHNVKQSIFLGVYDGETTTLKIKTKKFKFSTLVLSQRHVSQVLKAVLTGNVNVLFSNRTVHLLGPETRVSKQGRLNEGEEGSLRLTSSLR